MHAARQVETIEVLQQADGIAAPPKTSAVCRPMLTHVWIVLLVVDVRI
jgi:hypothetical protein